jgi:hypothetical protein
MSLSYLFSIILLGAIIYGAWRAAPREREEDIHVHGAGQVGLLAALALFGVDYFTSYFYATGEMMSALHPYGLQHYAFAAVAVIGLANIVFGVLYMYSLGVFNEGGGSFTASMRYLGPSLSLIVAVMLLLDYVFTIVVSTLSGVDQLLSLRGAGGIPWFWHFLVGASLCGITWFLTIRGRGESAQVVFAALAIFALLTMTMFIGLVISNLAGVTPFAETSSPQSVSLGQAVFHLLGASMKGLVALTGLEAMSNGIQFVIDEDAGYVKWGKKHLPRLKTLWHFFSGKTGIARTVQTSFLLYGGLTTLFLTYFAIHFNAFDGVEGRTLVGNLAFIGFGAIPGGTILFWAYQLLAVGLLTAASMTAFQDLQAITWRNVAIGEVPEVVVYRNPKGTFTRPVTAAAIIAVVIELLVRGSTSAAVPYYGVGVFVPIAVMGLAIREHIRRNARGRSRRWGMAGSSLATVLAVIIFVGQIVTKWSEGGWVVLIAFGVLILSAHVLLVSPAGFRDPQDIHRIIREKSRVQGSMGDIVEWQSLKMQEYRYALITAVVRFFAILGIVKPMSLEQQTTPAPAGEFEEAMHHTGSTTFLEQYLEGQPRPAPKLGGPPSETEPGEDTEN